MIKKPKISFGIIVLNGMPFVKYCLRQLYPFAHEIIVVEGASVNAKEIATKNGHSTDGTLEALNEFKKNEDPENKLKVITNEGFWSEKDEQSQSYAKVATGDYLWQVDVDEFYKEEDIKIVLDMLQNDPEITAVSFKQMTFWGGFDYFVDGWLFREESAKYWAQRYNRLFKWGQGYRYVTHRPPTVHNSEGVNLHNIKWVKGDEFILKTVFLYHYSLVFPKQVIEKCRYYEQTFRKGYVNWAKNSFFKLNNPFRVHNVFDYPSWLVRYCGTHPKQIHNLMDDIKNEKIGVEMRDNQDVEELLHSKMYSYKIFLLNHPIYIVYCLLPRLLNQFLKRILFYFK
ncbi:MAG: glycosyltransferase family 2 protein [Euryarchaeota archaeon HGW-Euryarchaeota-1]|nr:MAG: glycosyltransferase family 2 protein [Euryarchaeota archaeon HGW-Euryarchaeota-1]